MLFESDVIEAVCTKLENNGYRIEQKLTTAQHGDDIIASKQRPTPCRLHIEAKGETSSRRNSERYGQPFDSAQIRIHVAEALYKAAEIISKHHGSVGIRVGIALPDNNGHRARVKGIGAVIKQLGITVFWIKENGDVEIVSAGDSLF